MTRVIGRLVAMIAASVFFASATLASVIPAGYVSWDVNIPGSAGNFNISNFTGTNALPPDFPITTPLNLSNLSLSVNFVGGSATVFGSSYFTLGLDGFSFDGGDIPIGGMNPLPMDAVLSGTFSPLSISLDGGGTAMILAGFSAMITSASGGPLGDGDLAIIYATTTDTTTPVPEPGSLLLVATAILGLFARMRFINIRRLALVFGFVLGAAVPGLASAVTLGAATTPSSGVAGVSNVNANGSGYPSGSILPSAVTVHFAAACGGPSLADTPALSVVTILGSTRRVQFKIPASLATGTYAVSLDGMTTTSVTFTSAGGPCSEVAVTHVNATLAACVPGSSMGINAPATPGPVTAVVPRGYWSGTTTGVRVVSLEGAGTNASAPTTDVINSCASNPATGESVCTANTNAVYIFNAAGTLTHKLTSSSNALASFSGGSCKNCGVAINALANQAVINMGYTPSPSNSALQVLDLATKTFQAPKPLAKLVAENISIDPTRGFVLSPSEGGNIYDLVQFNSTTGTLGTEYAKAVSTSGEFDSAAEDCSTGIVLSAIEFTSDVYIADVTQATFTAGSPGTWTAPGQVATLAGTSFSAGTSGITVAPGSSHLGLVTGEFGGSSFAVLQLPLTSGSGTPTIVDYAYVPAVCTVSAGFDPHTITAYTSGNDGKAYGVMGSYTGGTPDKLAVLDLAAILAAPRNPGTHTLGAGTICPTTTPGLVRFVTVP